MFNDDDDGRPVDENRTKAVESEMREQIETIVTIRSNIICACAITYIPAVPTRETFEENVLPKLPQLNDKKTVRSILEDFSVPPSLFMTDVIFKSIET